MDIWWQGQERPPCFKDLYRWLKKDLNFLLTNHLKLIFIKVNVNWERIIQNFKLDYTEW